MKNVKTYNIDTHLYKKMCICIRVCLKGKHQREGETSCEGDENGLKENKKSIIASIYRCIYLL